MPKARQAIIRKHSNPYLTCARRITYAACVCGWERWYRCDAAGATIGWALHISREVTNA